MNFPNSNRYNGNGSSYVTINGRRQPVQGNVQGRDLADMAGCAPGRRLVKIANGQVSSLNPDRSYSPEELRDRYGNPVKITSIPDRTKGAELFSGSRDEYSHAIIREQVVDIALKLVKGSVDFDEDNADWMIIPQYRMPKGWGVQTAPLMIVFPRDYPSMPPIGFYLPESLGESPNGHFYSSAYHGASSAPTLEGWKWYCCTANSWQPYPTRYSGEWKKGDNLWTYITLVNEVLGSPIDE